MMERISIRCGATLPLDDDVIEPLRARLLHKHGFQADMEHFAIFGLCRECGDQQGD